MTNMTVIVVVALVFFAALCVITLLIWKRETEMRTDSLKAIEQNLDRILRELSDRQQFQRRRNRRNGAEEHPEENGKEAEDADPFAWVKTQETDAVKTENKTREELPDETLSDEPVSEEPVSEETDLEKSFEEIESLIEALENDIEEYEINLDIVPEKETAEDEDITEQYLDVMQAEDKEQPVRVHMGYDTGRSGRKYTAEELEMLIKE